MKIRISDITADESIDVRERLDEATVDEHLLSHLTLLCTTDVYYYVSNEVSTHEVYEFRDIYSESRRPRWGKYRSP